MSNVVFRGCEFREWKGVMDEEEAVSHGIQAANLTGLLRSRVMSMTPADKDLKKHAFDLDITEVRDFKYVANHNGEGDVTEQYSTFQVVSGASLKVSYEAQQRLPGTDSTTEAEPQATEEQPPLDNVLNMQGSGRPKKQRTRAEMSSSVVVEDDAAARKASQLQ